MVVNGGPTVYMHYSPTIPDTQTVKIKLIELHHNIKKLMLVFMLGDDQKSELYFFKGFFLGRGGGGLG